MKVDRKYLQKSTTSTSARHIRTDELTYNHYTHTIKSKINLQKQQKMTRQSIYSADSLDIPRIAKAQIRMKY